MAKINIKVLIDGAQKVLDAVQEMAPLVEKLGGPSVANVATITIAAVGVIENILERATDANVALTTQDETKLRSMLETLQDTNDKLAEAIRAS